MPHPSESMTDPGAPDKRARRALILAALLFLVTAAIYARAARFAFINYDDGQYVYANPWLKLGLSWQGLRWATTSLYFYNWHPITSLAYLGTAQLFGIRAGPFHVLNFTVHAINAALLCYVLWRMTGSHWASAAAAALYAWHPLRVESVAWISETKDVLSGLFFLLTILAYTRYAERPSLPRYLIVTLSLLAALASKPSTVTLPAVLLLLDYWPLNRLGWFSPSAMPRDTRVIPRQQPFRLALEKLPWLLLAAGAATLTMIAQKSGGSVAAAAVVPANARMQNAIASIGEYLLQTIWPSRLAIFYPHPFVVGLPIHAGTIALSLSVLFAICIAAIVGRRSMPFLLVGWLWFLGMLFPMLGLLQAGEQARADRYTYLPSMGLIVACVWLVKAVTDSRRAIIRRAVTITALLLLAALLVMTSRQLSSWRDSTTVFAHADRVTSGNYAAKSYLALAKIESNDAGAAIPIARDAVTIAPDHPLPRYALAKALQQTKQFSAALAEFEQCARLSPRLVTIRLEMGAVLAADNRPREALEQFALATRIDPANAQARNGAAIVLAELGDLDQAIAQWRRTIELDPQLTEAHGWLGTALQRRGDRAGAARHFRAAYLGGDKRPQWMADLAWLLAGDRACSPADAELAMKAAGEAVKMAPDQPLMLDTLAAAQARAGRFNDAYTTAQRAAALALAAGKPELAKIIQSRMMTYRAGRPYDAVR